MTHDASIQAINDFKPVYATSMGTEINFKDTYKANIAAYRLGKMLGLADMIPPSVDREVEGDASAVTWWVDVYDYWPSSGRVLDRRNPQTWTQGWVSGPDELVAFTRGLLPLNKPKTTRRLTRWSAPWS